MSKNEPNTPPPDDIKFNCPECGGSIAIEKRGAGLEVGCPHCAKPIVVPSISSEPPQPPASPDSLNKRSKNWDDSRPIKDVIMFAKAKTPRGDYMKFVCPPQLFEMLDRNLSMNGLLARTVQEMRHSPFEETPTNLRTKEDWDAMLNDRFKGYGWMRSEMDTADIKYDIVVITDTYERITKQSLS